jgi:predicted 3-demethylubiquinone-9 3-methyltransferase (glyoxalase superfamily)
MARRFVTHLMFDGAAEEAMHFNVSLFEDARVLDAQRYGAENKEMEGKLRMSGFSLGGTDIVCIDTPVEHDFTFTPTISIFVDCESESELERIFVALPEGGVVFMPLGNYGFSKEFGWVSDRFGVSWQLNLP